MGSQPALGPVLLELIILWGRKAQISHKSNSRYELPLTGCSSAPGAALGVPHISFSQQTYRSAAVL